MMKETFGQRLARLRKEKGLTQEDVASQITISPQAVSKWENDNSEPDLDTLNKLADIFNCSVDELLGREKGEQEHKSEPEPDPEKDEKEQEKILEEHASEVVEGKIKEAMHYHKEHKAFWITGASLMGLAVIAYLLMGLLWKDQNMGWKMGWVVFFLPFIISSIVECIEKRLFAKFAYPFLACLVYFTLGFLGDYLGFRSWDVYWVIFITIPAFYFIFCPIDAYLKRKRG